MSPVVPQATKDPTTPTTESLTGGGSAADQPSAVTLTAVSVGQPRLPGPGLASLASPTIVLSAVDRQGIPVTGLLSAAFVVQTITAGADRRFGVRDLAIEAFGEVAPGVYALRTHESRDAIAPYALVVSVTSPRASVQGRTLVRIDAC